MNPYLWGLPSQVLLPDPAVRSYRTLSPFPSQKGLEVYSLLHFPWARTPQALPGTLSYGARTFLQRTTHQLIHQRLPG